MKTDVTKTVKILTEVTIADADIIKLLAEKGILTPDAKIDSIVFKVPGGADWSNTDIDITVDNPIHVTIIESYVED